MSDETASDWLAAAIAETAHMPDELFAQGIREARQSCTFHGQIVPAVLRPMKSVMQYRASIGLDAPMHIDGPRGGSIMLGDVVKQIGYSDE